MEMPEIRSGSRNPWFPWAGILLVTFSVSCAKAAKPVSTAEKKAEPQEVNEPVTPAEPLPVEEEASKKPSPAAEPEAKKADATTIYIDSEDDDKPRTRGLVEASRAERERRAKASAPRAVITNKTLPQYNKGKVTVATPKDAKKSGGAGDLDQGEARWRKRGLDIRIRWRESTERVKQLELDTAGWRRRFYAENDPTVRDHQIKQEWDRTLDQLRQARVAVDDAKTELTAFLEEGRQAGALPGWLREGAELEPESTPASPSPTESIEPPILEIGPRL